MFPFSCKKGKRQGGHAKSEITVQSAIDQTLLKARIAIDSLGKSPEAMNLIQGYLGNLAQHPKMKGVANLERLYGISSIPPVVLASEETNGITLLLTKFKAKHGTKAHDHFTWGVLHVLYGEDHYIQWKKPDSISQLNSAPLLKSKEITLYNGQSTFWLESHDIHSQEAGDSDVWELVIVGKNIISEEVKKHRHFYN